MYEPANRSRIRLSILAAIAVGALALSFSASASAGSYTVYSCLRPAHLPDQVWSDYENSINVPADPLVWKKSMHTLPANGVTMIPAQNPVPVGGDTDFEDDCDFDPIKHNGVEAPGWITANVKQGPDDPPAQTLTPNVVETGFEFSAPPGTSITGFRIGRRVDLPPSNGGSWSYYKLIRIGENPATSTSVEGLCSQAAPGFESLCGANLAGQEIAAGGEAGVMSQTGLAVGGTQRIRAVVGCDYRFDFAFVGETPCPEDNDGDAGRVIVRSMQFQLAESVPPAVSNLSGSLIDDLAGSLAGVKTLNFHAADGESGVYRATIEFDNQPVVRQLVDENGGTCRDAGVDDANDFEFDSQLPCKQAVDGALQLDTGPLHEGIHTLRAYVEDAAGNKATLIPATEVLVSQTPNVAVRSCEPCNGAGGDPRSGRIVVGDPRSTLRVRSGAPVTLDGSLVDASGTPISGAEIDVLQRIHLPRQSFGRVKVLTTDVHGGFSFRPGTTSSRTVRFAFAPRRGSDVYSSTSDTKLIVSGNIKLRAKKRRIPAFGVLRLLGQMSASPLDAGVPLQIQARDGRRWRTIAVAKTTRQGRFTFRYRFRHVPSGRFQFRALASESSDLPIEPTTSRPVTVTVGRR